MKIWAITVVANEEDIISYNLSHLLNQGIDRIIVLDNTSTDKTAEILQWMECMTEGLVMPIQDNEPGHYQGQKLTEIANFAGECGADFIIPFDADELWYSMDPDKSLGQIIRDRARGVVGVPMWNHFEHSEDKLDANPFKRMVWMDSNKNKLDKVAFPYEKGLTIGEGNHNLLKGNNNMPGEAIGIGIRHFPYRGEDHFIRKIIRGSAALAATTLPESVGAHWRQYGESLKLGGVEHMKEHYRKWFTYRNETMTLVYDPSPYKGNI